MVYKIILESLESIQSDVAGIPIIGALLATMFSIPIAIIGVLMLQSHLNKMSLVIGIFDWISNINFGIPESGLKRSLYILSLVALFYIGYKLVTE